MQPLLSPLSCGLLLLCASCGTSSQFFRPTEKAIAEAPDGSTAAEYELGHGGLRWGEVRVWSSGAEFREAEGHGTTVLHVGFEIENATDQPISLDTARTRIEAIRTGDKMIDEGQPILIQENARANAHTVRRLDLEFALPDGVHPTDVHSFRVHWWLAGPDDSAYEQHTPFQRQTYNYGQARPLYYHPWHVRWGFGYSRSWCW